MNRFFLPSCFNNHRGDSERNGTVPNRINAKIIWNARGNRHCTEESLTKERPYVIQLLTGSELKAVGIGDVEIKNPNGTSRTLKGVLHVPKLKCGLMSLNTLALVGLDSTIRKDGCTVSDGDFRIDSPIRNGLCVWTQDEESDFDGGANALFAGTVFRIADHVHKDIGDRPLWTMLLSRPNLFQNATSASRRSGGHATKETFPNSVSRSVQTASNPKAVHPNQWLKRHAHVQTDQKVVGRRIRNAARASRQGRFRSRIGMDDLHTSVRTRSSNSEKTPSPACISILWTERAKYTKYRVDLAF